MKCGKPFCACVGTCFAMHSPLKDAAPVQQEHIRTDNKQTLVNALNRIDELESQNKALAGAAKLTIAWYEAEDDHSKADFYKRLEMCRASESALRAAIAAVEGK